MKRKDYNQIEQMFKNREEICKLTEKENSRRGEEALIEKLGELNDKNLTYFLLVAQALIAEENQAKPGSSD